MNNISTVDSARAVGADKNVTQSGRSEEAAKSEAQSGNKLPLAAYSTTPLTSRGTAAVTADRNVRVEKAVEQLNDYVQSLQRDLRFSLDEDLGRAVVRVVDRNTQEVIRQIPNELALRLARNLKEISGEISGEISKEILKEILKEDIKASELQQLQMPENGTLGLINTRI